VEGAVPDAKETLFDRFFRLLPERGCFCCGLVAPSPPKDFFRASLMACLTAVLVSFHCCSSSFLLTTLSIKLSMFFCSTVGSRVVRFFMAASNFAFAF
jgi:hypothetical protein